METSDITVGSSGTLHPDIHFLVFDASGDLWIACDGVVWESTDGGTGRSLISGNLTNGTDGYLLAMAVVPSNNRVIYTGSSDGRLFATVNRGSFWNPRS